MRSGSILATLCLTGAPGWGQGQPVRISVGPNLRVTPGEFVEPWIAASSSDPKVLIAAAHPASNSVTGMDVMTVISRDGGRSWVPVALPGGPSGFDPMVASGPDGRLYVQVGQRSAGYWARWARLSGLDPTLRYPTNKPVHRIW